MNEISAEPVLLTDDQHLTFLVDGYLTLRPVNLSDEQHRVLYRRAGDLYSLAEATRSPTAHLDILGDNLRARIPEVDELLNDPAIDGALTTVLGPDYLIHPHSYCHRSGDADQVFHQDGNLPWNERGHCRSHRTDWAMLFYYPQDVDDRNGPTEVVAGTQYWTVDNEKPDGTWHSGDRISRSVDPSVFTGNDLDLRDRHQTEALAEGLAVPDPDRRFLHLPAGSAVIAHYDLLHRGSRVVGPADARYMYKFYFARLVEPTAPNRMTGASTDLRAGIPARKRAGIRAEIRTVVDAQWHWSRGDRPAPVDSPAVARWGELLTDGREDQKVDAAYRLGLAARSGMDAGPDAAGQAARSLAILRAALSAETESTRRAAGHGLRQAGVAGVTALLQGLDSSSAPTRRPSAAGLGTVDAAESPEAVTSLIRALGSDPDALVRSNAAYSLGQIGRAPAVDVEPIAEALLRSLAPGAESDNAFGAGFSRSTVRQSAAFALVQVLANHRLADRWIAALIDGPLRDADRYVEGLIAEGLSRTEVSSADRRRLLRHLTGRRWSPAPPVPSEPPPPEPLPIGADV